MFVKTTEKNEYAQKLRKILVFSGWTQDHLADLLGVSNFTLNKWAKSKRQPTLGQHAERIEYIYERLVAPNEARLAEAADQVEKSILREHMRHLAGHRGE